MRIRRALAGLAMAGSVVAGGVAVAAPASANDCGSNFEVYNGSVHCYGQGYYNFDQSNVTFVSDGAWQGNWSWVQGGTMRNQCLYSSCPAGTSVWYNGVYVHQLAVGY